MDLATIVVAVVVEWFGCDCRTTKSAAYKSDRSSTIGDTTTGNWCKHSGRSYWKVLSPLVRDICLLNSSPVFHILEICAQCQIHAGRDTAWRHFHSSNPSDLGLGRLNNGVVWWCRWRPSRYGRTSQHPLESDTTAWVMMSSAAAAPPHRTSCSLV